MILDVRARVLAAEELLVSKLFVVRRERFDEAASPILFTAAKVHSTGTGCSPWSFIAMFIRLTAITFLRGFGSDFWFASRMSS
jgi:hypothetical protein